MVGDPEVLGEFSLQPPLCPKQSPGHFQEHQARQAGYHERQGAMGEGAHAHTPCFLLAVPQSGHPAGRTRHGFKDLKIQDATVLASVSNPDAGETRKACERRKLFPLPRSPPFCPACRESSGIQHPLRGGCSRIKENTNETNCSTGNDWEIPNLANSAWVTLLPSGRTGSCGAK